MSIGIRRKKFRLTPYIRTFVYYILTVFGKISLVYRAKIIAVIPALTAAAAGIPTTVNARQNFRLGVALCIRTRRSIFFKYAACLHFGTGVRQKPFVFTVKLSNAITANAAQVASSPFAIINL